MIVLAYAIMSNHFHIFIYVPEPEDIGDEEILRRINVLYREASLAQVLGERRTTNGAVSPRRLGATRRRDAAMPSCTATATGRGFAPATRSRCARRWARCWPYVNKLLRPFDEGAPDFV